MWLAISYGLVYTFENESRLNKTHYTVISAWQIANSWYHIVNIKYYVLLKYVYIYLLSSDENVYLSPIGSIASCYGDSIP